MKNSSKIVLVCILIAAIVVTGYINYRINNPDGSGTQAKASASPGRNGGNGIRTRIRRRRLPSSGATRRAPANRKWSTWIPSSTTRTRMRPR